MAEARTVVKKVPNCVIYSDGTIRLDKVRASYPHVFEKFQVKGTEGEAAYGLISMLPKATHREAAWALMEFIDKMAAADKAVGKVAADKKCLRDGDDSGNATYEACWTVSSRDAKNKPVVRDSDGSRLGDDQRDRIYGGCWLSVLIKPWLQNNKYGKRVNASLVAIQFVKDDEPFGNGRVSNDQIDETFDADDDDDEL